MSSELVPALITGGLGAAIGSIGTAVVQTFSSRGESRAIAADRVTNAAGNLADRLDKLNTRLEDQLASRENDLRHMRTALSALTEAVEDLLPMVTDATMRRKVQKAIEMARTAVR